MAKAGTKKSNDPQLTKHIMLALLFGIIVGCLLNFFKSSAFVEDYLLNGILDIGGKIFITLLKMIVVPIVLISLITGTANLNDSKKLGRMALTTISLYLLTTAIAVTIAIVVSLAFNIGSGHGLAIAQTTFDTTAAPGIKQVLLELFPENIIKALASGNMLQIILFAILFGFAIAKSSTRAKGMLAFFTELNDVVLSLISIIMNIAPIGVFCLVTKTFGLTGIDLIQHLLSYFLVVILALLLHAAITYSGLLYLLVGINPIEFFKRLTPAMTFAFSTSSSSASIPIVLGIAEKSLGVANRIAAFCIPLGATINMDGTAIMQGVATVFIANLYHAQIGISGYLTVIGMATLASIGTAGVPGIGLITLAMVLRQVGLPVSAIGLILGVDRLLDMLRTAVNISGDCVIAMVVAKQEAALTFPKTDPQLKILPMS